MVICPNSPPPLAPPHHSTPHAQEVSASNHVTCAFKLAASPAVQYSVDLFLGRVLRMIFFIRFIDSFFFRVHFECYNVCMELRFNLAFDRFITLSIIKFEVSYICSFPYRI